VHAPLDGPLVLARHHAHPHDAHGNHRDDSDDQEGIQDLVAEAHARGRQAPPSVPHVEPQQVHDEPHTKAGDGEPKQVVEVIERQGGRDAHRHGRGGRLAHRHEAAVVGQVLAPLHRLVPPHARLSAEGVALGGPQARPAEGLAHAPHEASVPELRERQIGVQVPERAVRQQDPRQAESRSGQHGLRLDPDQHPALHELAPRRDAQQPGVLHASRLGGPHGRARRQLLDHGPRALPVARPQAGERPPGRVLGLLPRRHGPVGRVLAAHRSVPLQHAEAHLVRREGRQQRLPHDLGRN
jgi:hypothetical protein